MSRGHGDDRSDIERAATEIATDDSRAPTMTPAEAAARADTVASDAGTAPTVTPSSHGPSAVAPGAAGPLEEAGFRDRYRQEKKLGSGGMGEVQLHQDRRIGRGVALKRLRAGRAAGTEAVARFVREARVQGQLEHPAIVPVYDLGVDPDGAPYFTMKRLRGLTLEQIVDGLRAGDAELVEQYPQRRLLAGFGRVCQAVEYAHRRGVLHRDLKPNNIMLGDFGEVYLLDWGVARIVGEPEDEVDPGASHAAIRADHDLASGSTAHGAVMGTPGYMAPEQLRGELDRLDGRADQYSLGAILFELLTLEPLHPRTSGRAIVDSTHAGADARARERAPDRDVPPELEAICVRATATDPEDRYPDVRAMADELERYLAGDRDLARRRELADEHAAAAETRAAEASKTGAIEPRKEALREAGRALALDPSNRRALATLSRLLTEPPRTPPPEAAAAVDRRLEEESRHEARTGVWMYLAYLLLAPLFIWAGVTSWPTLIAMTGLMVVLSVAAYFFSRAPVLRPWHLYAAMLGNSLLLGIGAQLLGPFILIPGLAIASTATFLFHTRLQKPILTIGIGALPILVPAVLEWLGVLPPSYAFEGGVMLVRSHIIELAPTATYAILLAGSVATIILPAAYIHTVRANQVTAEERVQTQAWQLRQLIPDAGALGEQTAAP